MPRELNKNWRKEIESLPIFAGWEFTPKQLLRRLPHGSIGEVTLKDGSPAILKLSPTIAAEQAWYQMDFASAARVIASAPGALLLEKLGPSLKERPEDYATEIIARTIAQLRPKSIASPPFPFLKDLAHDLQALNGLMPARHLASAHSILQIPGTHVLHGDLHHDNILASGAEWRVIDPHGYLGPPAFELAAMVRNPLDAFPPGPLDKILKRRIEILSHHLPFPVDEIRAWAFAGNLLSAAWMVSDGQKIPSHQLAICDYLAP